MLMVTSLSISFCSRTISRKKRLKIFAYKFHKDVSRIMDLQIGSCIVNLIVFLFRK